MSTPDTNIYAMCRRQTGRKKKSDPPSQQSGRLLRTCQCLFALQRHPLLKTFFPILQAREDESRRERKACPYFFENRATACA